MFSQGYHNCMVKAYESSEETAFFLIQLRRNKWKHKIVVEEEKNLSDL